MGLKDRLEKGIYTVPASLHTLAPTDKTFSVAGYKERLLKEKHQAHIYYKRARCTRVHVFAGACMSVPEKVSVLTCSSTC